MSKFLCRWPPWRSPHKGGSDAVPRQQASREAMGSRGADERATRRVCDAERLWPRERCGLNLYTSEMTACCGRPQRVGEALCSRQPPPHFITHHSWWLPMTRQASLRGHPPALPTGRRVRADLAKLRSTSTSLQRGISPNGWPMPGFRVRDRSRRAEAIARISIRHIQAILSSIGRVTRQCQIWNRIAGLA